MRMIGTGSCGYSAVMSGSEQPVQVALLSFDDQAIIGGIIDTIILEVDFTERQTMSETAPEVLRGVGQYTNHANIIQSGCTPLAHIITLPKLMTDLRARQFLPPQCDQTEMENLIQTVIDNQRKTWGRHPAPGTDEELTVELVVMTRDRWQSGEEVSGFRTQFTNSLMLAARAALAATQAPENRGKKFPDSLDYSKLDRIQLRGWIAQLRMVIQHKPATFPNEQSKMRYKFNHLRGLALSQIMPYIQESREIGLEDVSAFIQLLEAAFVDPNWVATAGWEMWEIKQQNTEFSQYYAEFQVIATNLDLNPPAMQIALPMGLLDEVKDPFTYSNAPDKHPAFVTICKKWDIQVWQQWAENAVQNKGGTGFTSSSRPWSATNDSTAALAGLVAAYTGQAPMNGSAGKRMISAEDIARRFADGRCLSCGEFNHRAAQCAARKKAQTFKVAGAEEEQVGTGTGSEESGEDYVKWRQMALQLLLNVLFWML